MVMGGLAKNESRAIGRCAALLDVTVLAESSLAGASEGAVPLPALGHSLGSNDQIPAHEKSATARRQHVRIP